VLHYTISAVQLVKHCIYLAVFSNVVGQEIMAADLSGSVVFEAGLRPPDF
jgi:hypothetical protein